MNIAFSKEPLPIRLRRCLILVLAAVILLGACSRVKMRAQGGSASKTTWEIGIPF